MRELEWYVMEIAFRGLLLAILWFGIRRWRPQLNLNRPMWLALLVIALLPRLAWPRETGEMAWTVALPQVLDPLREMVRQRSEFRKDSGVITWQGLVAGLSAWIALAGFAFNLAVWLRRIWRYRRCPEVTDPRLRQLWREALALSGIGVVRLRDGGEFASTPFCIWGAGVLIPEAASRSRTDREILMLMTHELAHVRRFDSLFAQMLALLNAIFWFSPFFYLARKMLAEESEVVCDRAVGRILQLDRGGKQVYGELLLALAAPPGAAMAGHALSRSARSLGMRLAALFAPPPGCRWQVWPVIASLALLTLPAPGAATKNAEPSSLAECRVTLTKYGAELLIHATLMEGNGKILASPKLLVSPDQVGRVAMVKKSLPEGHYAKNIETRTFGVLRSDGYGVEMVLYASEQPDGTYRLKVAAWVRVYEGRDDTGRPRERLELLDTTLNGVVPGREIKLELNK